VKTNFYTKIISLLLLLILLILLLIVQNLLIMNSKLFQNSLNEKELDDESKENKTFSSYDIVSCNVTSTDASVSQLLSDDSIPCCNHITVIIGSPAKDLINQLISSISENCEKMKFLKSISLLQSTEYDEITG